MDPHDRTTLWGLVITLSPLVLFIVATVVIILTGHPLP